MTKINIDAFLVARLSGKAGSLLLALLASRAVISTFTNKELMDRTGMHERSVQRAKDELLKAELITKDGNKLILSPELAQYYGIVTIDEPMPSAVYEPTPMSPGAESILTDLEDVRQMCERADALKDRSKKGQQIAALDELWRYLFPVDDFPQAARLNAATAREFLTLAGDASAVYRYLHDLDVTGKDIPYPFGYCRAIIKRKKEKEEEEKGATVDVVDIDDNWRAIAAVAVANGGKNGHKKLKGYQPHSVSGVPGSEA